jgi:hypothetical protein
MLATAPRSTCGAASRRTELLDPASSTRAPPTSAVYLDMLENFVFPKTVVEVHGLIFQQNGAPANFGAIVRTALDEPTPWSMDRHSRAD